MAPTRTWRRVPSDITKASAIGRQERALRHLRWTALGVRKPCRGGGSRHSSRARSPSQPDRLRCSEKEMSGQYWPRRMEESFTPTTPRPSPGSPWGQAPHSASQPLAAVGDRHVAGILPGDRHVAGSCLASAAMQPQRGPAPLWASACPHLIPLKESEAQSARRGQGQHSEPMTKVWKIRVGNRPRVGPAIVPPMPIGYMQGTYAAAVLVPSFPQMSMASCPSR